MSQQSGDKCPKCGRGRLKVRSSRQVANYQQQRLECEHCDYRDTVNVPAERVWRRRLCNA